MFRILLPILFISAAFAQDRGPDFSRFEITGSYWPVHTSGSIQANGTPVDLQSDLGVTQGTPTFTGKLDLRLGARRRNHVKLEGTPFRLDGSMNLSRSITYQGQTYSIDDHVTSKADLDYFYAGYQFDAISVSAAHFGIEAGGAYLNATGAITSQITGVTASRSETVGLPLAGLEFRAFPVHGKFNVEINADVKGMDLGSYGHYVQATANVGIGHGPLLIEGGYRWVNADIHDSSGVDAVAPRFRGPLVSLELRL